MYLIGMFLRNVEIVYDDAYLSVCSYLIVPLITVEGLGFSDYKNKTKGPAKGVVSAIYMKALDSSAEHFCRNSSIAKTRLFKYKENFIKKPRNFSGKKL